MGRLVRRMDTRTRRTVGVESLTLLTPVAALLRLAPPAEAGGASARWCTLPATVARRLPVRPPRPGAPPVTLPGEPGARRGG